MGIRTPVTGVKSPCPRPLDDEGQRAPHYIQSYNFDKSPIGSLFINSCQHQNPVMIGAGRSLRAVVFAWNRAMRVTQYTVLVAALLLLAGCGLFSLGRPDLASDDPALKIPAMKLAAQQDDKKAIPTLIKALSSQDSAIRFYAIYALHKITGHRFGFIYYASKSRRNVAAARWKRWFATQRGRGFHLPAPKLGHAAPVPVISGGAS